MTVTSELATLHPNEASLSIATVRKLIDTQFPEYKGQEISPVAGSGTVNRLYRLGDEHYLRFPRTEKFRASLRRELKYLPLLADAIELRIPVPVAQGEPDLDYPFDWAIYKWLDGEVIKPDRDGGDVGNAAVLAVFVSGLARVDIANGPTSARDLPLEYEDKTVLDAIEFLGSTFDERLLGEIWQTCARLPRYSGERCWTHGDLIPPNVLVRDGQLVSVIDFGSVGMGDPAVDYIPAWSILRAEAREYFRESLRIDDVDWLRAMGLAFRQAVRIIPYYEKTNPSFALMATETLQEIVAEFSRTHA